MFNWACKLLKFLIVLTTNKMFIRRGEGELAISGQSTGHTN